MFFGYFRGWDEAPGAFRLGESIRIAWKPLQCWSGRLSSELIRRSLSLGILMKKSLRTTKGG